MTIMTKNGVAVKKMEIIRVPLGEEHNICDEDKIEVHHVQEWVGPKHASRAFVCMSFMSMMIVLALTTGLLLYRQYNKPMSSSHRYQGYCSVPLPADFKEETPWLSANIRQLPFKISEEHDFQIVSTFNEKPTEEFVNALREELDIGESVEKIGVVDNGHHVNFIHDFNSNLTGIVDSDRCFIMDLEPELVLGPAMFAASLSRGEEFDVSQVRSALRAVLPALNDLASSRLASACETRPAYKLSRDETILIRKRSAEDPPHDYIHFSGKHVHKIKIENLQEIINFEKQNQNV